MGQGATDVLLVEDAPEMRVLLARWLERDGLKVEAAESAEDALERLERVLPEVVCLDLELPGMNGLEAMAEIRRRHPALPVVFVTAHKEVDTVVEAMRVGAFDYLVKPVDRLKLATTLKNAMERRSMHLRIAQLERESKGHPHIWGQSPPMNELFRQIDRLAPSPISVLIHGESGTGKELVAKALHDGSPRADGPFVAINCAAIPESLQESELFGHEKGAFTGAQARRRGHFEAADQGTLFLDEIAETSPALQAKLLRVLQERSFARVGGDTLVRSDFRLVAASHKVLADEVAAGRFREDLFYRIAVFELDVPPLRERGEDVLHIAERLVQKLAAAPTALAESAKAVLRGYAWPGNVRELENAVQHALVVCRDDIIHEHDLPKRLRSATGSQPPSSTTGATGAGGATSGPDTAPPGGEHRLEEVERRALMSALERNAGSITEVAKELGIGRTTVYRKMKKFGLK